MRKKMLFGNPLKSVSLMKIKNFFHSREIHQRALRSQKNHGSWFLSRKIQKSSWPKSPWNLFWFRKVHGNQFRWFQKDLIEFVNEKFPEVCSAGIDSMKFAFIYGETRPNTISLTETPDEPISYNCNASKLVFFQRNSTNFIHRQPSENFFNDQNVLKINIIWKKTNSQSSLEKRSWKNLCW